MATTAEVLVGFLANAGVGRIFGVTGEGSNLDMIEAARVRRLQFVAARSAASAAFMAATDGDLAARPGILVTSQGSSTASAVVGVAHAHLDRLPLIVLAGAAPRAARRTGFNSEIDFHDMFQGITKERAVIAAARAERLIAWAWEKAVSLPAGPVHMELPSDQSSGRARTRSIAKTGVRPDAPSPSAIRKLAKILARGGRAAIVAGLGCRDAAVAARLRELVDHLGAPTLATPRAKGALPEDHPLAAGVFSGGRLEEEFLGRADSVLTVGLDSTEIAPQVWKPVPSLLSMAEYRTAGWPAAAEAVGALPEGLVMLREALPPAGEWSSAAWAGRGETFRERVRSLVADACRSRTGGGVAPHRVVEIAREAFPRPTIATVDSGAHALVVNAIWEAYEPKAFLCSSRSCGAGYALPAAIAAKLAAPDRHVLAFMGDSGFLLNLPELSTAVRLDLPLVLIVFVDDSASLSRVAQEQKRYAPLEVSLGAMDIPKVAEGLGALGTTVDSEEGLRAALSDTLATTRPAIVAVRVNPHGYRRMVELLRGKGKP
jgi:acetolactate synthase-1/2/3 large subunit